jgi:hypothetical protein
MYTLMAVWLAISVKEGDVECKMSHDEESDDLYTIGHTYMTSQSHLISHCKMSLFALNSSSLLFLPTDDFQTCFFTSVYIYTAE